VRLRGVLGRDDGRTVRSTDHLVRSAVAVGSEMRSRAFAGCVAVTNPVGGELSAGSTVGPRRLVRCQTTLLPSGSSPTMLLLLVVADKLLLVVSELAVRS